MITSTNPVALRPSNDLSSGQWWPNGARIAMSVSIQFEAGGQPISGAGGPITEPIAPGFPDLPTNSYFDYGVQEGLPRLLDLCDKHEIKFTSFMIGRAVDKSPALVQEIFRRGHECAAHGREWSNQYQLSLEDERAWIVSCADSIERATGQRPSGYDSYWSRHSVNTLELLQQEGFAYHIDDLSRDEPFVQRIGGAPFVTVPYNYHLNDIVSYDFKSFSPAAYEQQLRDEFDQLYEEGGRRRRMMSLALHDRLSGHASRARGLDRFLTYVKQHQDVWFARKDEIARWALATPDVTPVIDRGSARSSGLPSYA